MRFMQPDQLGEGSSTWSMTRTSACVRRYEVQAKLLAHGGKDVRQWIFGSGCICILPSNCERSGNQVKKKISSVP